MAHTRQRLPSRRKLYTIRSRAIGNARFAAKQYLDLTADDVREAFARWIRPDDLAQVTLGPVSK